MVTHSQTRRTPATAKGRRIPAGPAPATIERSEPHARNLWRKTRATAIKTYGDDALARRLAFSALKDEYERRGNRWVRKEPDRAAARPARRGASAATKTAATKTAATRSAATRSAKKAARPRVARAAATSHLARSPSKKASSARTAKAAAPRTAR